MNILGRESWVFDPHIVPHVRAPVFPKIDLPLEFKFVARGGISRWESSGHLELVGFTVVTSQGQTNKLMALAPASLVLNIAARVGGEFECRYGIVLFDHLGRPRARFISPTDKFLAGKDQTRCVETVLNPVQLGPGEYTASVSIHKSDDLSRFNSTLRHDLLSRSFELTVDLQESLTDISAGFFHSAEWRFTGEQDYSVTSEF